MSDGSLSQDEIDALMQNSDTESASQGIEQESKASSIDVFQRMLMEAAGSLGSNLGAVTNRKVVMTLEEVLLLSEQELLSGLPEEVIDIKTDLIEGIPGEHSYILDTAFAGKLASVMMGQENVELNEAALSAIGEAISQLISTQLTSLSDQSGRKMGFSAPDLKVVESGSVRIPVGDSLVCASYKVELEDEEFGVVKEIFAKSIIDEIVNTTDSGLDLNKIADDTILGSEQIDNTGTPASHAAIGQPNVQPVQFANFETPITTQDQGNISLLMDVDMQMTVELGRTKQSIKEILGIGEGTIIELDKLAGEPVDILVNHKPIAKGEVVVIDENFGVRVTEIISPADRMGNISS